MQPFSLMEERNRYCLPRYFYGRVPYSRRSTSDYIDKLLGNFSPKEVLFRRGYKELFQSTFDSKLYTFEMDDWVFTESQAYDKLIKHFDTKNLKGFGIEHLRNGIVAAGAILQYLEMTQHTQIGHITSISRIEEDNMCASTSSRYAAWS